MTWKQFNCIKGSRILPGKGRQAACISERHAFSEFSNSKLRKNLGFSASFASALLQTIEVLMPSTHSWQLYGINSKNKQANK